ncbi:MAG: 50S ribosomal protein L24 [Planctomycetota bacterium]|nr:MAG: 50S ribosomal protein L24 [Planctomycetota bacterium]
MAARIRKDDIVEVIAGEHKGARGKVLRVFGDRDRVLIEGVNMVVRHVRPSQRHPQGGRIHREAPIHISNVQPIDPKTDKPTRVRFRVERDDRGRIVRKFRESVAGSTISEVTRASAASAAPSGE